MTIAGASSSLITLLRREFAERHGGLGEYTFKARPTYRRICDEWDQHYEEVVAGLCDELIEDGDYRNIDAPTIAYGISSMINGLWLSCLISPQTWDRNNAMDTIMSYLRYAFPKHFKK